MFTQRELTLLEMAATFVHNELVVTYDKGEGDQERLPDIIKSLNVLRYKIKHLMDHKKTIVCLCGSTRFCADEYRNPRTGLTPWQEANLRETLADKIVLSIGVDEKSDGHLIAAGGLSHISKEQLDALHIAKITWADEILVINVGGYIGESTKNEIAEATRQGKLVGYWEPV